jgi:hypothetical protein
MARRRKIPTPAGPADAEVVGFRSQSEEFNQYLLDDGTVLKLKIVVTEILRVDGQWDAQGNPAYLVQSQQVVSVDAPDHLRKEPG